MKSSNSARERKKILELAKNYKKKGFVVVVEPSGEDVPAFVKELNYRPDLIVTSEEESLVIEVTSNESAERLREIIDIVDAIEEKRGWRFVLVVTNSKPTASLNDNFRHPELEELQQAFDRLVSYRKSITKIDSFAAQSLLLMSWAVLEGLLRMYLYTGGQNKRIKNPKSLIRDAVMYGFIDADEGEQLTNIVAIRNSIAHGAVGTDVSIDVVDTLIRISDGHLGKNQKT